MSCVACTPLCVEQLALLTALSQTPFLRRTTARAYTCRTGDAKFKAEGLSWYMKHYAQEEGGGVWNNFGERGAEGPGLVCACGASRQRQHLHFGPRPLGAAANHHHAHALTRTFLRAVLDNQIGTPTAGALQCCCHGAL